MVQRPEVVHGAAWSTQPCTHAHTHAPTSPSVTRHHPQHARSMKQHTCSHHDLLGAAGVVGDKLRDVVHTILQNVAGEPTATAQPQPSHSHASTNVNGSVTRQGGERVSPWLCCWRGVVTTSAAHTGVLTSYVTQIPVSGESWASTSAVVYVGPSNLRVPDLHDAVSFSVQHTNPAAAAAPRSATPHGDRDVDPAPVRNSSHCRCCCCDKDTVQTTAGRPRRAVAPPATPDSHRPAAAEDRSTARMLT